MPTPEPHSGPGAAASPDPRRWWLLAILSIAQLIVILDVTIVNIALPSAQEALGISDGDRQWMITAYGITFGGLLLIGGRIGDLFGRKRTLAVALVGFGVASGLGGLAGSAGVLFAARALQGAFAALMAPTLLSLLTVTFTDPVERTRAFGIWGGLAGMGGAIGLVLGGVLTEYASWRWTLLVNTPVALALAVATWRVVRESRGAAHRHLDVPGAVVSTLGLGALVYGFTRAEQAGWGAGSTVALLAGGVLLLGAFLAIEARSPHPLLPLRVLAHRERAGAFLATALLSAALFGHQLFVVLYLQGSSGMSAVTSGLAFVPASVAVIAFVTVGGRLLPAVGPRAVVLLGMALGTAGMAVLATVGLDTAYALHVLPGIVLMGAGIGLTWPVLSATALVGVPEQDAGSAGGMVNVVQQVGGALGVALLNTMAAAVTSDGVAAGTSLAQAQVDGYRTAFWLCAAAGALGLVAASALLRGGREASSAGESRPVHVG
jgi:EmrB/QacA subfamily drug resistance transporter